jgi:hypothetical protein
MPQPLRRNKNFDFLFPWNDPTERAECAIQMTGVIVAWTGLEEELAALLGAATGDFREEQDGGHSGTSNPITAAALGAIDSLHARLAVVNAVWEAVALPSGLRSEFETLSKDIRKAAGWRNLVAHTGWMITKPFPNDVIHPQDQMRYSSKDFEEMRGRIREIHRNIAGFSSKCIKHFLRHPQKRNSGRLVLHIPLGKD